ncbi:MAG: MarR family transcriptional regulator [Nostocaceae cyanobacterium]|nr:MarR family transcriptional regulator [Nostocaceae cyanobacterium]
MADLRFDGSVWCNIDVALRHIDAIYSQETEPLGLNVIEWYILQMLYVKDGQMASRLAEGVGRAATAFTPLLDGIQNKGLIERRQHTADRRAIKIFLTGEGKALQDRVKASAERVESKLRQQFSDKEWQSFQRVVADFQTMAP